MNSTTNNNHLSFSADMRGPDPSSVGVFSQTSSVSSSDSHGFGVYQLTTDGTSGVTIRTLVLVPISAFPFRKALIAKFFFRQILGYTDSPSISISYLISTVVSYFDMSTAIAKNEAEVVVISIRDSIFCVDNISGVGFLDSTGESITITEPDNRPRDVSYFTFYSFVNHNTVDNRAPNFVRQFEFCCAYLPIPPLLLLIFRCRALLLFPINHWCLHSIQHSVVYRMFC